MILKLLKPREIRKFASVLNRAGLNFPQSISGSFSSYLDLLLTSKGVVTYQKQCVSDPLLSIQVSAKSLIAYTQLQDFFRLWYLPLPMLDPSTDAYLSQWVPLTTYTYPTVIISCAGWWGGGDHSRSMDSICFSSFSLHNTRLKNWVHYNEKRFLLAPSCGLGPRGQIT